VNAQTAPTSRLAAITSAVVFPYWSITVIIKLYRLLLKKVYLSLLSSASISVV